MCGITGAIWNDPAKAVDAETLRRMTDVLRHRGPDDEGEHRSDYQVRPGRDALPGVALGHRRLAVIDLTSGHQPMPNEDETVWVVANGEIYNYHQLRRRLEGAGHRFRTDCDSEVIVHLYEDEDLEMLQYLQGMFALAVWDARKGQLLLARDRLGQKPLVYRHEANRLLFASELKSLLEVPGVPREVDPRALDEYLTYQYVPYPRTIFRGIAKLLPAHYLVYRNGDVSMGCYWDPDFNVERRRPYRDTCAELRETLTEAVRTRLQSDVPLGAFLSGGVDSTIIVGLMQKLNPDPVRTFSIGFPVAAYDETRYARMAAERFGTAHEEFQVEPQALDVIERLVWHFDEPFADSSAVPTWYVSQLTKQHVTVSLTGDGGDELFAGYARYRAVRFADWFDQIPAPFRRCLAGKYWQKLPASTSQKSILRRWKRFVEVLGQSPLRRYMDWIAIFNESRRAELYSDEFLDRLPNADPIEWLWSAAARSAGRDPVTMISLTDLVTYLPCDLMNKVDIASMAHALECRQPFLDHRVVELAMSIPIDYKLRGGHGKRILLDTFADLIPKPIRKRPKMGFGVPLDTWFRGPLAGYAREVLLDSHTLNRGFFRRKGVQQLLEDHQADRFDHSYRLWALLILELWHRQWIDSPS
jgi:asparagine synthase (glutamine-hydrolysing)